LYRSETEQLKAEKAQLVNQLNQRDIDNNEINKRWKCNIFDFSEIYRIMYIF